MGKTLVTDPDGVQWSVHRVRPGWESTPSAGYTGSSGSITGDLLGVILQPILELIFDVIWYVFKWPFWFIGGCLGMPSTIVIERDGTQVGAERVRGWGKSRPRIQEIAESVAAGTIKTSSAGWAHDDLPDVSVIDKSGTSEEPTRCVLHPIEAFGSWDRPTPGLAVDVGKDTIWVINLNTNALIASAWLAQATATPAKHDSAGPVLVVDVPGLPTTLTIRPPNQIQRHSWRGEVVKTRGPVFLATEDEPWLTLVKKFDLTPYLEDRVDG
jgi:hypothetical protein